MDIVLIRSDSLETVKITHANYVDDRATVVAKNENPPLEPGRMCWRPKA